MKTLRYAVFAWSGDEQLGGWHDYQGSEATLELAQKLVENLPSIYLLDEYQIVDLHKNVVWEQGLVRKKR